MGLRAIAVAEVSVSCVRAERAGRDRSRLWSSASEYENIGRQMDEVQVASVLDVGVAPQSQRDLELCSSASRVVPASGTAKGTAPS